MSTENLTNLPSVAQQKLESSNTYGVQSACLHDQEIPELDLFSPLKIRDLTLRNRVAMSPMCQYSAENGVANDWHFVHLGSRAVGGAGLIMVEATAVTSQGRITPGDLGIWDDAHIEPLARIARFVRQQGAVVGIQLAHAGRKASSNLPWLGGKPLTPEQGAWETVAPSSIGFNENSPVPIALDERGIEEVITAFVTATERALQAGFQMIEIHAAHGYLLHSFLSPLSNQRTDNFGGSLENRMRLLLEVARRIRATIPEGMPLFVRISATDWVEGGWDIEQSVILSRELKVLGVDLIDVSTGGLVPHAKIPVDKGYQVPFAAKIRQEAQIYTAAVGLITEAEYANQIITRGCADLVLVGRELLRDPYWPIHAQCSLDEETDWPVAYGYAVKRQKRR
ncbi:NADH:flavin oxidoreductase/NADH oxidase [Nostoc sp. FACHB-152]|uniref:NADH:flavin oxidoreductase/NADH oxidase n=1 Tax=unclassified Nostoc TaxID=2593658 RepID=UPI001687D31C|nr:MULTISPECIES: NADH:flavin oxidoreductase/NADH oxidase [unclassified Nostoc]MBD2448324.1 NADH:flavin oxidoreductase/NADH oxidase [Nostoc sp. FACHB-152]MBD2467486.1 NADH:flavin oxidoreductase/NADH oxidase [Nostoc sp. FACHB-145]